VFKRPPAKRRAWQAGAAAGRRCPPRHPLAADPDRTETISGTSGSPAAGMGRAKVDHRAGRAVAQQLAPGGHDGQNEPHILSLWTVPERPLGHTANDMVNPGPPWIDPVRSQHQP
jgi:hypothetical protein